MKKIIALFFLSISPLYSQIEDFKLISDSSDFYKFIKSTDDKTTLIILLQSQKIELYKNEKEEIEGNITSWINVRDIEIDLPFTQNSFLYETTHINTEDAKNILLVFKKIIDLTPSKIPDNVEYFHGPNRISFFHKNDFGSFHKKTFWNIDDEKNWELIKNSLSEIDKIIAFTKVRKKFENRLPIGTYTRDGYIMMSSYEIKSVEEKIIIKRLNKYLKKYSKLKN